eukprot:TRINITY_DN32792_c0_g1_i1.p1 TRINITY_DN32792_c0_g1~~TRINITY_DN32792_c0_g1_i1.p1  ORF type:complete len:293 (+),score=67.97 TRINITY_DN32792_c0_g1_i1:119-997(+)
MIRQPPRSTLSSSSAASDVYKRQHLTLVARNKAKLEAAQKQVKASCVDDSQCVQFFAADSSVPDEVNAAVAEASKPRPIDVLIACAGISVPGYFAEQDPSVFEQQMTVNYLGSVYAAKAVVPQMMERKQGHIVFIASAAAVVSFIGYSSYAPTKWALRGLADALRNELCGFGIRVAIGYPPDTQTPGFDAENETKPAETLAISAAVGGTPYSSESVAQSLVYGMERGDYHLPSPDLVQNRLVEVMIGVSPRTATLLECLFLLPVFSLISGAIVVLFDHFAKRYGTSAKSKTA